MKQATKKFVIARGKKPMNPNGRVRVFGKSRENIHGFEKDVNDEMRETVERKYQLPDEDDRDLFSEDFEKEYEDKLEKRKRDKKRMVVIEYGRQELEEEYHQGNLVLKELFDGMVSEHQKLMDGEKDDKAFLNLKDYWENELAESILADLGRREMIREVEVEEEKKDEPYVMTEEDYDAIKKYRDEKPLRDEADLWRNRWYAKNRETRLWKDGRKMSYEMRFAEMLDERERSFE